MKVLVILHVASEGPGTLGEFLEARGVELEEARLHGGDPLPAEPGEFDAVISMGGPMNVYEVEAHPFLEVETAFLRDALERGTPILGICLGAQMIAKAAGARVIKSPAKEVGWSRIQLTPAGQRDPWLAGLPGELEVFQWHEDMFEIPPGGSLLAASEACPHQALRFGSAVGLQFHVEVTEGMLSQWFRGGPQADAILRRSREIGPALRSQAERFYENFLRSLQRP